MKIIISVLCILSVHFATAQSDMALAKSGNPIEMLFPQGKTKALVLSFDDGRIEDRQLVQLMNQYGLVGTFHLNSNKLGTAGYLTPTELKSLFKGHEVSVHSANHPNLTALSKIDVVYEVVEDRKRLEQLVGYPVRGMAYPFGNTNDFVIDAISGLGIEYARTVGDSFNFSIPTDFLKWQPTIHLFGKTNYKPNDEENDKKELAFFYQVINDFKSSTQLAVLDVWGHSWEMGDNSSKWAETEKFFNMLANNAALHYTTQIDLVDYIKAFRSLQFSVEKTMVYNPSSLTVCFKLNSTIYTVLPGKTVLTN